MINIFFNHYQNRLRAGWRILICFLLFFSATAVTGLILQHFISTRIIRSLMGFLVLTVIALGSLWLGGRYLDHRRFKDYGFNFSPRWWLDFIFGFILGAVLFGIIFLFEKGMGWIKIIDYFQNQRDGYIGMPFVIPFIMGTIFFFIVGLYEEILFRAYQITNLSEGLTKKNAVAKTALIGAYILSSVIFGLFHSGNQNASYLGVINIVLTGLFIGLPYILTGELAMPVALHFSWNFFQGLIFGFPVSGEFNDLSIIAIEQSGSNIWTGGAFGPEGGLVVTFAVVVGCSFVLIWYKILHKSIPLFTKMTEYNSPYPVNEGIA